LHDRFPEPVTRGSSQSLRTTRHQRERAILICETVISLINYVAGNRESTLSNKLPVWSTAWESAKAGGRFIARYPALLGLLIVINFASKEASDLLQMKPETFSLRAFAGP
jgi:hypothetical protein